MTLRLRPATFDDAERLRGWRNDPVTRAASFDPDPVAPEAHADWLERKLADPRCVLLIADEHGRAVGQVRLELEDARTAEVHIAVAPEARGRGVAREALAAAAAEARQRLGVERLRARIKPDNDASLGAFRSAGFETTATAEDAVEMMLVLRPSPR